MGPASDLVRELHLDFYSLRHAFASQARNADVSGFLASRALGHATSGLVDEIFADPLPSGMAQLAEPVAERELVIEPRLRLIDGGKPQTIRQPLVAMAPRAGVEPTTCRLGGGRSIH